MYCNKCGNEIREDSIFCDKCGNQIKKATLSKKETSSQEDIKILKKDDHYKEPVTQTKVVKKRNKGLKVVFFLLLVVGVGSLTLASYIIYENNNFESVFKEGPQVDSAIYSEWGERPFSIGEIGD